MPVENPIPILFPKSLQDECIENIVQSLIQIGKVVENRAKKDLEEDTKDSPKPTSPPVTFDHGRRRSSMMFDLRDYLETSFLSRLGMRGRDEVFFTRTDWFSQSVATVREFLINFVAAPLIDILANAARREGDIAQPGHVFLFSVLYNERLQRLVACHHDEQIATPHELETEIQEDPDADIPRDWTNFLESNMGSDLFLAGLGQMSGLFSLTLHHVTDLGLIYLCGIMHTPMAYDHFLPKPATGCKYLKELVLNPHTSDPVFKPITTIMPKVLACLLKHLRMIEVLDMNQLHEGIKYYYLGPGNGTYHPKPDRIPPLKLIHYTGSDNLSEVMPICPKLRTFKLHVTNALSNLGQTLKTCPNSLDHVSLMYTSSSHTSLFGLQEFLSSCGDRISSLGIECTPEIRVTLYDLQSIATHCKFLERLSFNRLKLDAAFNAYEGLPVLKMPFLTSVCLSQIDIGRRGKEFFRFFLGGCPDIEKLYLSFPETAYFFNDFVIEEIIAHNPLNRLESLIIKDVSLTLISALRLISTRGKLRHIGSVMTWDVEPSELLTFAQILRNANSLKLLQKITIV
ncbi:hypothetical protein TCAL_16422 [Tigriopus californicus]|uniref:Uncharacterized protein n=1 Tax=Tigriopus californicus TaxID=6832 RepID=A0A553NYH0_TIGCA|nr:hypothetical protein TCAL_16422 [Tigriopus californicus]